MRGRAHALIPAVVFILCFGACQRKGASNGKGTSVPVLPPGPEQRFKKLAAP